MEWVIIALLGYMFLAKKRVLKPMPKGLKTYAPLVKKWAAARNIPYDVLVTWARNESGFNPNEYNPEPTAVLKWSCEVANNPKWKNNPDYSKAVAVCTLLQSGAMTVKQLVAEDNTRDFDELHFGERRWTFGSIGFLQVSRQVASEVGAIGYNTDNIDLFDIETNLKAGTAEIAKRRSQLYPGRTTLTDEEWSRVRAAYVGGPGILSSAPGKAQEISDKFLASLDDVRQMVG